MCHGCMTDLGGGGGLGDLPGQDDRSDPAPPELLEMEEAGAGRLAVQRRQPPPPGRRGGPVVPAFQPLVLEEAAPPAGRVLQPHHCSSTGKAATCKAKI